MSSATQTRIAKHAETVAYETGVIAELTADLRQFTSLKNPRARRMIAERKAAERRLATAKARLELAEGKAAEEAKAKIKVAVVPQFTVLGPVVRVTIPETAVELERTEWGGYEVWVQDRPCSRVKLGTIDREGSGWTARGMLAEVKFTGDHFPTRTGKHTQTYALAYLIAIAAGQTQSAATYDLHYEGVSA